MIPGFESCRPKPEFLTPPKSVAGEKNLVWLIMTMPDSIRSAALRQRSSSAPNTEAPSPKGGCVDERRLFIVNGIDGRDRPKELPRDSLRKFQSRWWAAYTTTRAFISLSAMRKPEARGVALWTRSSPCVRRSIDAARGGIAESYAPAS